MDVQRAELKPYPAAQNGSQYLRGAVSIHAILTPTLVPRRRSLTSEAILTGTPYRPPGPAAHVHGEAALTAEGFWLDREHGNAERLRAWLAAVSMQHEGDGRHTNRLWTSRRLQIDLCFWLSRLVAQAETRSGKEELGQLIVASSARPRPRPDDDLTFGPKVNRRLQNSKGWRRVEGQEAAMDRVTGRFRSTWTLVTLHARSR